MNKNILSIKEAKETIRKNKKILRKYFEKRFPYLFISITALESQINKSLETLLCSSLKFKTTRIELPTREKVNYFTPSAYILSRTQCLTYKGRSENKELFRKESQVTFINKKGDLYYTKDQPNYYGDRKEKLCVRLSILKNHSLVNQNKLKKVLKFRLQAIKAQRQCKDFFSSLHDNHTNLIKISKRIHLSFSSSGFSFEFEGGNSYKTKTHKNFEIFPLHILFAISKNWKLLNKILTEKEKIKKEVMIEYQNILEQLESLNRPYLVLQTLTKK